MKYLRPALIGIVLFYISVGTVSFFYKRRLLENGFLYLFIATTIYILVAFGIVCLRNKHYPLHPDDEDK